MVKRSLTALGVAIALAATVSTAAVGEAGSGAACVLPESNLVESNADFDEFNHAVQDEVARAVGEGKAKEPIAAQLRRGVIGTVFNPETHTVTTVLTPEFGKAERLREQVAAAVPDDAGTAEFITGCHSAAALIEAEAVLSGRNWHPEAAKASFAYSLRGADSRFHVSFDSRYPAAADALRAKLGARGVVSLGENSRLGRLDDGRPHYGGAGIREGYGSLYSNTCTSGFSVRRNHADKQYGSITAGHCFNDGAYIYSGPKYYGYSWGKWNFPHHDTLGIRSGTETYDNVIHVDPCCPSTRSVIGRHWVWPGDYVCLSGMVTRAICSVRVTSTSGYFCDPYGCTGNLIEGVRNNEVIARAGDSGGPIYVRYGSYGALGAGMIVAGAGGGTLVYGERITTIESHLNVTLLTS